VVTGNRRRKQNGADGSGSRIDIRSVSRQGRSDFGVNARRIRAYLRTLQTYLGSAR
jgi:uncharacterized protein (DUF1499 family)